MTLIQFDNTTEFLYGNLEDMNQPEGFEDGTSQVCRLHKTLYGLKQAPRCWNKRFNDVMKLNVHQISSDSCLYTMKRFDDSGSIR